MISGVGQGDVFVGRQKELAVLETALNDALSGHGRLVMLSGEPGIGKTRVAQEIATQAQAQGAQVLWGWCYEGEGAPPTGPGSNPSGHTCRIATQSGCEGRWGWVPPASRRLYPN